MSSLLRPFLYGFGVIGVIAVFRRFFGAHPMILDCSTEFTAGKHGPQRSTNNLRLIVLHSTDPPASIKTPTARSTAQYFAAPPPVPASTHLVVDDTSCYRTLGDDFVPYGASGGDANTRGLHIEMAGHSTWTRAEWLAHDGLLQRAGAALAMWANAYGIPLVLLGPQAVGDGIAKGVTTHANVTAGFHVAGGHQDPGPNFPFDVLFRYARGG